MQQTIFVIDDTDANLLKAAAALKDQYRVITISSAAKMFSLLEKIVPDLILLDIEMPEMNGFEAIKKLKEDHRFKEIPVIFLTARVEVSSELEGFDLGATDYVTKPFSEPRLQKRVYTQLLVSKQKKELLANQETLKDYAENLEEKVREKTSKILNLQNAILTSMADVVEFRDRCTGGHIYRTQAYLKVLVDELIRFGAYASELKEKNLEFLVISAQLHDVGKVAIPDNILNKPAKLEPGEYEIMKTHVAEGTSIINRIIANTDEQAFFEYALKYAETHHEKWDGTGYPRGLKGTEIPLEGRMMAIVDVYDALIAIRPYKPAFTHSEAKEIVEQGSGTFFDPDLVNAFLRVSDVFVAIAEKEKAISIR
jgi:putative two-component system response regulator